jgi:hypothetical protein
VPDARLRRARLLAAAAGLGAVGASAGWLVTDRLEQDDRFCVSCHLAPEQPLHAEKAHDFRARPAAVLAAAHATAGNEARDDGAFRCIDCHGGTGALGRARVKLLSAKDAFWYAVGRFDEPEGMRWPLWDADCRRCHERFAERDGADSTGNPLFHELAVHNVELPVRCVECHAVHDRGGLPDHDFVLPPLVRAQCARCHSEFEEGEG